MIIPKNERLVHTIDATSRVVIRAINWSNNPRCAQLGQAAHDASMGGLVSLDRNTALTDNAQCLRQIIYPQQGMVFYPMYAFPMDVWCPVETMPQTFINAIPSITEKITGVTPQDMPSWLSNLTGQDDFVYLSRALKLDQVDYDQINSGAFIRVHADNTEPIPAGCTDLPIWDHLSFIRRNVLYQEDIFTVKYFRYANQLDIYPFLFKPDKSCIWFPNRQDCWGLGRVVLCTEVQKVLAKETLFNALYIDAGKPSDLDWRLFRNRMIFFARNQNEYCARNELETLISFVAEAQKHKNSVSIIKDATLANDGGSFFKLDNILSWPELTALVERFDLEPPDSLRDEGFIFDPESRCNSSKTEQYWPECLVDTTANSDCLSFYGSGNLMILEILLRYFDAIQSQAEEYTDGFVIQYGKDKDTGWFPRNVGIICPFRKESQRDNLLKNLKARVLCIPGNLHEDELRTELHQNRIKVLLVIGAAEYSPKKLADVLSLCKNMGIPVGLFSMEDDGPEPEVTRLVSQSFFTVADGKSLILKNMKFNRIERFRFDKEKDKVFVKPSNEAEIKKLLKD